MSHPTRKSIYSGVLGLLCILVTMISLAVDPQEVLTKHLLKIENGSYIIMKMEQKLYSYSVQMFLFNVTNPEAFVSGDDDVLKVQEVGPFTYKELRTNLDMEIDKENNTFRYTSLGEMSFVPERSIADPDKLVLNFCNPIFLPAAALLSTKPFLVKRGFNLLMNQIKSKPIINMTVSELLWGYEYTLMNFGNFVPGIAMYDKMGMAAHMFGDNSRVRYEVDLSEENRFSIKSVNGSKGLVPLGFNKEKKDCNTFIDTYEGLFFPAPINPKRRLRVYHKLLCRFLAFEYVKEVTLDNGFEGLEYRISKDAFSHNVQNECYCGIDSCYKGISVSSPCFMGLPVAISQGHFLEAEDKVFRKLEGLHPNEKDHGSQVVIHKRLGIPLRTRLSIQMSIMVGDVSYNTKAKPFSNMMVPIGYGRIEQEPLPEDIEMMIKFVTLLFPTIVLSLEIAFAVIGICLLAYSLSILYYTFNFKTTRMQYCTANTTEVNGTNETPFMS